MVAAIAGVFILSGAGIAFRSLSLPTISLEGHRVGTVRLGRVRGSIEAAGTIVGLRTRALSTALPGRVESIVAPGTRLSEGAVVITLSNPAMEAEAASAQSDVNQALATYASEQASLEAEVLALEEQLVVLRAELKAVGARETAERKLADAQIISRVQLDQTHGAVAALEERVALSLKRVAARARSGRTLLAARRASVQQLEASARAKTAAAEGLAIRAPFAGVFEQAVVAEGDEVSAGTKLGQLTDPSELGLSLALAPGQAAQVREGQPVTANAGGTDVRGAVSRVHPAVENGAVHVDVILKDANRGLRVGQLAESRVEVAGSHQGWVVDRPSGASAFAQGCVYVVEGRARARKKEVRFGAIVSNEAEIAAGLTAPATIVLTLTCGDDSPAVFRLN